MGINTKEICRKEIKTKKMDPKQKLERDLKSCMRCRFFHVHNNQCINNKRCSGTMTDKEKADLEEKKKAYVTAAHMERESSTVSSA